MTGWLILAAYLLGYAATWRTVVWGILTADRSVENTYDAVDVIFSLIFGSLATLAWPLIRAGLLVRRLAASRTGDATVLLMPRPVRQARRIAAQQERIHELERQVGIQPPPGGGVSFVYPGRREP
jgi:hypothetical protein